MMPRIGLEQFHLYGRSGGGAIALAFTAAYPDRVLSLALDEAAFDFSEEMRELAEHRELHRSMLDDPQRAMATLMQLELTPGVGFAPPAGGSLSNRPEGSSRCSARSNSTRSTSTLCADSGGRCSTPAAR